MPKYSPDNDFSKFPDLPKEKRTVIVVLNGVSYQMKPEKERTDVPDRSL